MSRSILRLGLANTCSSVFLRPAITNSTLKPRFTVCRMSTATDVAAICQDIEKQYSCCDVADALLKLKAPWAGFLPDIVPIPASKGGRVVAQASTLLFVPKSFDGSTSSDPLIPQASNIPKGQHWTDCPKSGTIVLMQQPKGQVCAILGDLLATRLKVRGVKAALIDGRVRDVATMASLTADGDFQVWSKAISAVGTGMEAKQWATDVPIKIGEVTVNAGDIIVADGDDRGVVVIPQNLLQDVHALLPGLKTADDRVLEDILAGVNVTEAFARHR